jgi:hypothetical protein
LKKIGQPLLNTLSSAFKEILNYSSKPILEKENFDHYEVYQIN